MRLAVLGLAAGPLSGGLGHGLQLFEELLDIPFITSVVLPQLSLGGLHLLPVFVTFITVLRRQRLVSRGVTEQGSFIFVLMPKLRVLLSKFLPQLPILLLQAAQR